jgi:hypothetical protein
LLSRLSQKPLIAAEQQSGKHRPAQQGRPRLLGLSGHSNAVIKANKMFKTEQSSHKTGRALWKRYP